MKKLLLFVVVLFGILSVQSFAWNYGCGENIPPHVCGADGSNNGGGYGTVVSTTYYGGMAVDVKTRKFSSAWNYQDGESAKQEAMKSCGNMCVGTWASSDYMVIAISEDDKNWGYGASDKYATAWQDAINMCQKSNKVCEVAIVGHPTSKADYVYWGALAYNTRTGAVGVGKQGIRSKDTSQAALDNGKCLNNECTFFAFQENFGALAQTSAGIFYKGVSNKNLKEAEKQAVKNCKKESKEKTCEVVASTSK